MRKYKSFRKPYQVKRKKSILKNRFFWLGILFLVFIGILFYFFIFSSFFQVKRVIISGNEGVPKEEIKAFVEDNLEKKILFLPTKSIFLANLRKIEKDILNNFPQIAEIEIGRGFPNTLSIIMVERLAIAVFCQNENCFLLDTEGVIFGETKSENELIKIKKGQKEKTFSLGEKIIEKDYLEKIFKIQKNISELEIKIEEFVVFKERLNVKAEEGWEIYFDLKGDLNWQLTKLSLVLKEKIPPENRGDLEYIELRFGDLAPFRYKEE